MISVSKTQPHVTLEKKIFQIYFQIIETITFNEKKTDYKRMSLNCTIMIVVIQTDNPIDNAECSTDD